MTLFSISLSLRQENGTQNLYFTKQIKPMYRIDAVNLLRIRNPWGHQEWNGAWRDESPLWNYVDTATKDKLLTNRVDGEFWISEDDFCDHFNLSDIPACGLTPDFDRDGEADDLSKVLSD